MAKTLRGCRVSLAPLEPHIPSQNLTQVSFLQRRGSGCSLMALTQNCQSNDIVVLQPNVIALRTWDIFHWNSLSYFIFRTYRRGGCMTPAKPQNQGATASLPSDAYA